MADHRTSTLQYGHLGTVSYLPDIQCWRFSRHVGTDRFLTFFGGVKLSPEENYSAPCTRQNDRPSGRNIGSLLNAHPNLAPSLGIIGRHEAPSQAITAAASTFDPLVTSRFALGNASILDEGRLGDRTVAIAVFTSCESPATLLLQPLCCDSVQWPENNIETVEIPIIDYTERASWIGKRAPIQQVVAPDALDEKGVLLALRYSLFTVVLQPLYHRSFPSVDGPFDTNRSKSFDANPLIEIPHYLTGGHPHADVAFNPWYQRQIAIVDSFGKWSIWDVQGRQPHKGLWNAERGPCGSLALLPGEDVQLKECEAKDNHDGWAAILWVGSVSQLLVCDRRTVALFRIDVRPPQRHNIDLNLERRSEWVLDVRRSRNYPEHIYVVTSTRIFWISIVPNDGYGDEMGSKASILLSWRHFRDIEDTSLKVTPFSLQNEICLLLYSQLNPLAQVFKFSMSTDDPPVPISVCDPLILSLPFSGNSGANIEDSVPVRSFSSIFLREIEEAAVPNPSNESEMLTLLKFVGHRTSSGIVEAQYSARTKSYGEFGKFVSMDSIPPMVGKKPASILSSTRAGDDDFVVDDDYEPAALLRLPSQRKSVRRAQHAAKWLDQHVTVSAAVSSFLVRKASGSPRFNDWLSSMSTMLRETFHDGSDLSLPRTMLDIVESFPAIDDIDENSTQLESLLGDVFGIEDITTSRYRLVYLPLPWSSTSGLSPISCSTASPELRIPYLYDSLISEWLSPLSQAISGKIRVSKERLTRKIITELTLSRLAVFPRDDNKSQDEGEDEGEDEGMSLTGLQKLGLYSDPDSSLPNIISSQATSFTLPSSQPQSEATVSEPSSPTYSTLRLYTTLNPQLTIPKRISTTLSHWKVGSDPSSYDWQNTVKTLQVSEEESQLSERRRMRAERKRKLQLERASQRSEPSPSVPPSVSVGGNQLPSDTPHASLSQPRFMQSSQVTQEERIPMSQVVRGLFGSREASKKFVVKDRKKKRAAGF